MKTATRTATPRVTRTATATATAKAAAGATATQEQEQEPMTSQHPPRNRVVSASGTADTGGIGRASALLASGTIVSRILGFLKVIILAGIIGAFGDSADAFGVANQLPNTIYVIVAGGILTAVLVPQIVRASLHADGGTAYINKLLTIALLILAVTTIAATLLAPFITAIIGVYFSPDQLSLASAFAYWCIPQMFFYGLYTLLGEVLNARKSFGPFTWVPVLNNVVAIAGLLVFSALFGADPNGDRSASEFTPG